VRNDLSRTQITGKSPFGRETKRTPHLAPHLRRDTDGKAGFVFDIPLFVDRFVFHLEPNGLDGFAVTQFKQIFDRPIGGTLFTDDLDGHNIVLST
jgi:hypothetical protein